MPEDSLLFGKPPPWSKDRHGWGYGFNYGRRHGDGFCEMHNHRHYYKDYSGDGWIEAEGRPVTKAVWDIRKHT